MCVSICLLAGISVAAISPRSQAVTVADIDSAVPATFGDLVTFNWRILEQATAGAIPVPATPTGNNVPFIRMFTNGNTGTPLGPKNAISWDDDGPNSGGTTTPPNYPDTYNVDGFDAGSTPPGRPIGSSELYYGLEFSSQGQTTSLDEVTTVGEIKNFMSTTFGLNAGDAFSPILAFDQNQEGGSQVQFDNVDPIPDLLQRDLLLRGRLFLLDPSLVPLGSTPAQVDAAIAAAMSNQIREFLFLDDPGGEPVFLGGQFPHDDAVFADDDDQWVLLPGVFNPDPNQFTDVDNNGSGNNADWGGYLIDDQTTQPLDLMNVAADDGLTPVGEDWLWIVELQGAIDTNGKEEAYILAALGSDIPPPPPPPNDAVPEPITAGLGLLALAGLGYTTKRRRVG